MVVKLRMFTALSLRQENAKGLPSEAAIKVFVHDFREWFNNVGLKDE